MAKRMIGFRPKSQLGFSFIEVLIVMGIIAVLVGGVIVVTQIWGRKRPEFQTQDRLRKLEFSIKEWKRSFETYPPTDPAKIPVYTQTGDKAVKMPQNKSNLGIESVVIALNWKGFKYDPQFQDPDYSNTDEDELRAPVGKNGITALREIVDGWGNPIIYIHNRDYKLIADDPATYTTLEEDVEVVPWRNEDGTFSQPMSFQLFSMGPDGIPNTEDDIRAWVK